ncbi:hypothetical protein PIB30_007414 [Stylosanthes scabra]|uniref:Uncharacterized protein n=1 Tax=Stylosanthes scabra TaxID=79078 RepID=A0ABU6Q5R6_9FABA|nr:hypothetical protein [Stylosanthes scabra]
MKLGLGEELQLFGRRSVWIVIGPPGIENKLFTFQATNKHDRNPVEYYLGGLGWERFRKEYALRTFDSLEFHIMDWRKKVIRIWITRGIRFGSHVEKLTKSYMRRKKLYLPVGLGEELQHFGRRSVWTVIGPDTIEERMFTFEATNMHDWNPIEFYFSLDWQRFRDAYGLRTWDTLEFYIMDWLHKVMRVRIMRYHRRG